MPAPRAKRRWSPAEDAILRRGYSWRPLPALAHQLQRSLPAIQQRAAVLKVRRYEAGYTFRDLEVALGVSHHTVRRWYLRGWLAAKQRTARTSRGAPRYLLTDEAIAAFLRGYPKAWRPERVTCPAWVASFLKSAPCSAPDSREAGNGF